MKIFIITGEKDSGKTLFLKQLHEILEKKGLNAGGFLSLGDYSIKGKKDFLLFNLSDKVSEHLATRIPLPGYTRENMSFYFNPVAIRYGESIIKNNLEKQTAFLLIDEIGPLELMGKVWHTSLLDLLNEFENTLIISVRRKFLQNVISRYKLQNPVIVDVSENNPGQVIDVLTA